MFYLQREWLEIGPEKHERSLRFLYQSGMTLHDLDNMGVIHVAGTKGKGSTCALTESILRQRGLKTGLFTSPHMVSFRERIRINGEPLSKEKFAKHFWKVYDRIVAPNDPYDRPSYFQLLTILALNIFWDEGVDVAVMEVGVGGRFDATNIIRSPIVCGITTLDIDHTGSLGNTIEEIALHKAGIMKTGRLTIVDGFQRKVSSINFKKQHITLCYTRKFLRHIIDACIHEHKVAALSPLLMKIF